MESKPEQITRYRDVCHYTLTLRLRTLTYPNNTIGSFWFTANVRVNALEVYLNDVESVLADALNANAFRGMKKVTLLNFELQLLVDGIFNGLDDLDVIYINSASGVSRIETGVLDGLTELQEFTFEQSLRNKPELSVNGLFGSAVVPKLEYVKIRYYLTNTIKRTTFVGLRNVKRLDLSSCQINSIEDNSFDPISETIEELDLSGNALTTIAYGVFSMILPNIKTINIGGNSWDCVCELMAFRAFIEQYQQSFIGYDCASPTHCRISNILESDCFDTCEMSPTTTSMSSTTTATSTTTTTTTTTPTTCTTTSTDITTTISPDEKLVIDCPNDSAIPGTVSIRRPIGYMRIIENEYGEAHLIIETEQDTNSLVVIRFDETENSGKSDEGNGKHCLSVSDVSSVPLTDLRNDAVYFYCLMQKSSDSVSPLDCIPYVSKRLDEMDRLFKGSNVLIITLVAVSLLLSFVLGMTIAFCWMRYIPFLNITANSPKV